MSETSWFWRIVCEGGVVALFVVLAVFLPWLPIQLFFVVLLAYVLWLLFRNPRFFYRRLVHVVLWVLLLPPLGELSLRFFGYSVGETGGILHLALELGPGPSPALLTGLVFLFVAADLLSVWLDGMRNRAGIGIVIQTADLYTESDRRFDARISMFVTAPAATRTLIGASGGFRASLLSGWMDASVFRLGDNDEWIALSCNETIDLSPASTTSLQLRGEVGNGLQGGWLLWWSRRSRWLRRSHGGVFLTTAPELAGKSAPVTFQLRPPTVRP